MDISSEGVKDSSNHTSKVIPDKSFFTIFIFPFKYFKSDPKENSTSTPAEIRDLLCGQDNSPWKAQELWSSLDNKTEIYNEWHYFHTYVRNMIFSFANDSKSDSREQSMVYLVRKDFNSFSLDYYADGTTGKVLRNITVDVKSIDLHMFDNQIGLLTITTEKSSDSNYGLNDLLKFNDLARRVYPPHIAANGSGNTEYPKKDSKLIPDRVKLFNSQKLAIDALEECFPSIRIPDDVPYLSKIIKNLLTPLEQATGKERDPHKYYYDSFTDDRMFIVSHYVDKALAHELAQKPCGSYAYEVNNDWYKFVFVDGEGPAIANETMKRDLIQSHTYARWADYGTLLGMSRYSLVILHDGSQTYLYEHAKGVYYQLALIILFQRAMLLEFSEEIKELTIYFRKGVHPDREFRAKADDLHGRFIKFTNEYWYTEITPQEQGIELYRQWTSLMEHDYLFTKVKSEIQELAVHVRAIIEHESNQNIALITNLGLPISVVVAIWTLWLAIYGERSLPGWTNWFSFGFDPWKILLLVAFYLAGAIFLAQLGWSIYKRFVRSK